MREAARRRFTLAGAIAFAGLAGGCLVDASLGSWSALASESGATAPSTSESTDSDETGDSGDGLADGGDGDGEPGDGDGEPGDGDGGDGDGEPGDGDGDDVGVCTIEASDTPCDTCLKHLCCPQLEACGGVDDCFCMLECLMTSDPVSCAAQCQPGLIYIQLVQCRAVSCAAVCS